MDAFEENISGVATLIADDTNKVSSDFSLEEGIEDYEDILALPMEDDELLKLKDEWENKSNGYLPKIKARQDLNRTYVRGVQRNMTQQTDRVVPTNLIFEATATFAPLALAENPEPVVFSDNTEEGKLASNDLKTMLQYHADTLCLRGKLNTMVWHWSIYFTAILKYGWDTEIKEIKMEVRKPQNFVFDPDGYVDEYGDFKGEWIGERIKCTADELVEMFPEKATYIRLKVNDTLGTVVTRTEWWTDKYCFTTFEDEVLDKHKNEFFNYPDSKGESATPTLNQFATPKMPYTFLSVFSLQEQPHDFTNLVEQNIANQDRINDRDDQISKNLASANNSVVLSGTAFTEETADQAVQSFYEEGFLLVPNGDVDRAVKRIPANNIPESVFKAQENDKENLRSVYGTLGSVANTNPDQRVRNNILNEEHDSSRIGGGVGDSLERVAKNAFNWLAQLYCVFYDEKHYGAAMGRGRAVEYVGLLNTFFERKFVISVAPNSMKPKDEISQQNLAMERWNNHGIDPIGLMKELDDADPMESAKRLVLWTVNPQLYLQQYFPESSMGPDSANTGNPAGPSAIAQESPPSTLAAPPASASLSNVPIKSPIQIPR